MELKAKISKIHYDKSSKSPLLPLLEFCSVFYDVGSRLKNYLYQINILKPKKVNAYVVSVGNLTTGGVGKTPFVAELVKGFQGQGKRVCIVSRGYGGKLKGVNIISDGKQVFYNADKAGDEPYWLATNTTAVVVTSPLRYDGAKLAIEKYGVDVIILDDGFQHRKLYRDLNILLIDSEKQFGNEKVLPAGPLRECVGEIRRADRIVVVSKNIDHANAKKYALNLYEEYKMPVSLCCIEPDFVYNIFDEQKRLQDGERVVAFSAIGQPQQFYKFLTNYDVVKTYDYNDHHAYEQKDFDDLEALKLPLITTEKDAVKCRNLKLSQNVYALKLRLRIEDIVL